MLVAFRFQNFRSFREKAELSLIPHRSDKTLKSCLIATQLEKGHPDSALPVIALYGANAAGKSNVLFALEYMHDAVTNSQAGWKPSSGTKITPFADSGSNMPSVFEIDIIINKVRYNYGFSGNPRHFAEEWLYSYPLGRERKLFYRKTSWSEGETRTELEFGEHFPGDKERDLDPIARRTRANSLFLSAAAQDNHALAKDIFAYFTHRVATGMTNRSDNFDGVMSGFTSLLANRDERFFAMLRKFMKLADAAIDDVVISEGPKDEAENELLPFSDIFSRSPQEVLELFGQHKVEFLLNGPEGKIRLPIGSESGGVRRLYAILSRVWLALAMGSLTLIDELEASIHPLLARLLVDTFQNKESNPQGAQLIFTTHDTNLLDRALLRRDQIWFVEKHNAQSCLYSLLDFSPRKDENLEVGYLRGRYGAIPALGLDPESFWSTPETLLQ